jgi:hypothetical protein
MHKKERVRAEEQVALDQEVAAARVGEAAEAVLREALKDAEYQYELKDVGRGFAVELPHEAIARTVSQKCRTLGTDFVVSVAAREEVEKLMEAQRQPVVAERVVREAGGGCAQEGSAACKLLRLDGRGRDAGVRVGAAIAASHP